MPDTQTPEEKAAAAKAKADAAKAKKDAAKAKKDAAAKADAEDKVEEEAEEIVPLARGAVKLTTHIFQFHAVAVPSTTPKDVPLASDFWKNNANKLNPGDEIRVITHDYSWVQTLLVTYKAGSSVGVVRLNITDIEEPLMEQPAERFNVVPGLRGGYIVKDMVTGKIIGPAAPTRSKAERQREDHERALGL